MPAVKDVGEPGAGEPHARFDEAAGGIRCHWPSRPTVLAPPADPTATGVRGGVWYAKWRGPDGRQIQRRLGAAWTRKSAPPEGHLTRRGAEAQLRELLVEAQRGHRAAKRALRTDQEAPGTGR